MDQMSHFRDSASVIKEEPKDYPTTDSNNLLFRASNNVNNQLSIRCMYNDLEMYRCKNCDYTTHLHVNLNKHLKVIHQLNLDNDNEEFKAFIKRYKCVNCSFRTYSKLAFIKHNINCGNGKSKEIQWFECEQCPYKTKMKTSLKRHLRIRHNRTKETKRFQYTQCSFKTHWKKNLNIHTIAEHTHIEDIKWFKCKKCSYQGKSLALLKKHVRSLHAAPEDIYWFECDKCSFKSKRKNVLDRHVNWQHTSLKKGVIRQITAFEMDELRKCQTTNSLFCAGNCTKNQLSLPMFFWCACNDLEMYRCKSCDYTTLLFVNFNQHLKAVHQLNLDNNIEYNQVLNNCRNCSFETYSQLLFMKHRNNCGNKKSAPVKRLKCGHCSFKTLWQSSLNRHIIKEHTATEDIKWFKCEKCSYQGKFLAQLKQHVRTLHAAPENIRWFECDSCSFKAKRQHSLNTHVSWQHTSLKKGVIRQMTDLPVTIRKQERT